MDGETKSAGYVFNQMGFFCQQKSGENVRAKSFISVWAVSLKELEELRHNYPSIEVNFKLFSEKLIKR